MQDNPIQPSLQGQQSLPHLLASKNTVSVAIRAFSFSPKVTAGLRAAGFSTAVNLLRETSMLSMTCSR